MEAALERVPRSLARTLLEEAGQTPEQARKGSMGKERRRRARLTAAELAAGKAPTGHHRESYNKEALDLLAQWLMSDDNVMITVSSHATITVRLCGAKMQLPRRVSRVLLAELYRVYVAEMEEKHPSVKVVPSTTFRLVAGPLITSVPKMTMMMMTQTKTTWASKRSVRTA